MEKAEQEFRQVRIEETNASEPLMKCRKVSNRCRNRGCTMFPGSGWGELADCPTGIRHEGGVTLIQALVRNVGTCRPDAKEEAQADSIRKSERTEAGHRGGVVRSREESSAMGLDRRDGVVWLYSVGNPQGEDLRG